MPESICLPVLYGGKWIPRAWVVCWSLDETQVQIREGAKREGRAMWVAVQFDRDERYYYCEVGGVKFFLCSE